MHMFRRRHQSIYEKSGVMFLVCSWFCKFVCLRGARRPVPSIASLLSPVVPKGYKMDGAGRKRRDHEAAI